MYGFQSDTSMSVIPTDATFNARPKWLTRRADRTVKYDLFSQ
jgi:hypothetical protein